MMLSLFRKDKTIHLAGLLLLLAYIFAANPLYVNFILRDGKPVAVDPVLPQESDTFDFDFGSVQSVRYDGQNLYELKGYALHRELDSKNYQVKVVLHSTTRDFVYDADRAAVPDIIKRRADYHIGMRFAEFRFLFSEKVLPPDNYRIGLLLEDEQGAVQGFKLTNTYIELTPNTYRYIYGQ